jgi:hypothetical protein
MSENPSSSSVEIDAGAGNANAGEIDAPSQDETGTAPSAVAPASAEGDRRRARQPTVVSFSDVVRAHHGWDLAAQRHDEARTTRAREVFAAQLAQFQRLHKLKVVDAYWSRKEASAVVLTELEHRPGTLRRFVQRVLRREDAPDLRLERVTDWVTGDVRELADLLHQCDVLAIKAVWGLEGLQRAVVMQWLFAVEAHVLGFVESEWERTRRDGAKAKTVRPMQDGRSSAPASEAEQKDERDREQAKRREEKARLADLRGGMVRELRNIEGYYLQAGQKRARLRYVEGMLVLGTVAIAISAVLTGAILDIFGLLDLESAGVRRFYACMTAGAVGAIVSVLTRMGGSRGGFTIDHELGSFGVMLLGSFRPLIGAVSGVILSFLVQTDLVPIDKGALSLEFYVVVAFLAGFSERWTQVILEGAMRTIDKPDDISDDAAGKAAGNPENA